MNIFCLYNRVFAAVFLVLLRLLVYPINGERCVVFVPLIGKRWETAREVCELITGERTVNKELRNVFYDRYVISSGSNGIYSSNMNKCSFVV